MSLSLGIDTGGTYTDAVVYSSATETVLSKAKALTTRHDLSIGIAEAAGMALDDADVDPSEIGLVSISTTLATNALVEGQGGRIALVMIGFEEPDLEKAGLRSALGDDPVVFVRGGHTVHGRASELDLAPLDQCLQSLAVDVSAFAVAGYFAVRNPEHEIAARDLISARADRPVTCSHELSSKLDGPRRALTTVLNARLIGLITGLIGVTRSFLAERDITAPLMVVRGDGSLVSAEFAASRPIETILSGPAASLVGAQFLTGREEAFVSDIGGTTTDIALLDQGRPRLDPAGATVGGHRTMVEAIAVRTFGLGGDSEVRFDEGALNPEIHIGPRRLVPVSLLEYSCPNQIVPHLQRQLNATVPGRLDARFALRTGLGDELAGGLDRAQSDLYARLAEQPQPLDRLLRGAAEIATLDRLVARGLAYISGFTPTDAQHVARRLNHWDREAAKLAAGLLARRKDGRGKPLAATPEVLAERVIARIERLSAERLLQVAFAEDGLVEPNLAASPIVRRALDRSGRIVRAAMLLDRPVIGLGAGASAYYPAVGELLGIDTIVPEHADVANAIGAVAGQVRVSVTAEIAPAEQGDAFIVSGADIDSPGDTFADEDMALEMAETACREAVAAKAASAGAPDASVTVSRDIRAASLDGKRQFITATITAVATGRPARA